MSVTEDYVHLLMRVREMCLTGQTAGAELELHSVYRRAGCPACVKVVLAALLARRGRNEDAQVVLRDVTPRSIEQHTPSQVRLAIAVLMSLNRLEEAEALSKAYHRTYGRDATRWLHDMSVPGSQQLGGYGHQPVEELADDLAREPKAIQALVYAQHHKRDLPTIALLRQAIRRIVPIFEDDPRQMTAVCRAMAELAVLAAPTARRWPC
jgi:hypothetical protein